MRLRATQQINSAFGTYPAGQIFEVADEVGAAWIEARLAEPAPAPAAGEDSSTVPPEKPLHRINKAELQAIATDMGLDVGGSNKQLVERIRAARQA